MRWVMRWLGDRWLVLLAVIVALTGALYWVVTRRTGQGNFFSRVQTELDALRVRQWMRGLEAEAGAEQARAYVHNRYREDLERLTETQKKEAEGLINDPARLAQFLVRAGARADPPGALPGSGPGKPKGL